MKAREILIPAIEQLHSSGLTILRLRFILSYLQFLQGISDAKKRIPSIRANPGVFTRL